MKRILVVDDDVGVQKAVQSILEAEGYEVGLAIDGLEGLKVLETSRPDLIIADYAMPRMSGDIFCREVKRIPHFRATPFIFLTGHHDIDVLVKVLSTGATDFITKPFRREEFLARVAAHIAHYDSIVDTVQADFKQMRANLLSNVSHELRTPLSIIMGHAGILVEDLEGSPEILRLCLDSVYKASVRLNQVVEDMIFLSQAQSGRLGFYPRDFAIESLLEELIKQFDDTGDKITLKVSTSLPQISADYSKLKLALKHLIDNAIKFSDLAQPAKVTILVSIVNEKMQISVADEGIGLSETLKDEIFEPLFQADDTAERLYEGLGAGLKIVQYVAMLHHGHVSVESQEGHGSTFTLTLPLQPPN